MTDPSASESTGDGRAGDPRAQAGGAPSAAWPIVLRFDLTVEDMAAFYRSAGDLDPAVKRAWDKVRRQYRASIITTIVLVVVLVVGLVTDMFGMSTIENRPVLAIAIGAGVVGAWWTAAQYRRALTPVSRSEHAAKSARSDEAGYHMGPQTLSIGPTGLSLSLRHHDIVQRWSGITAIRETPDGIYFQRIDRHCYVLPKRVFVGVDEAKAVVAQARRWLDQGGHGDARRVRAFLAERDVPCPACGYNLRGATAATCPECGRGLDFDLVNAAAAGVAKAG